MRKLAGEIGAMRLQGVDAWIRPKIGSPVWLLFLVLFLWLFVGRMIDAITPIWSYAWATTVWFWVSVTIVAIYSGRRRSLRTYDRYRDLVSTADIVGVGVPDQPSFWKDFQIIVRYGNWKERSLLGSSLIGVAESMRWLAGGGASGVTVGLSFFACYYSVMSQRLARVELLRQEVYERAGSAVSSDERRKVRDVVDAEIAALEARLDELQQLSAKLSKPGGQVEVLEGIQRTLLHQNEAMATDGRTARRRDYLLAVGSLILGAIISEVIQRGGLG